MQVSPRRGCDGLQGMSVQETEDCKWILAEIHKDNFGISGIRHIASQISFVFAIRFL